ncbi:MAG TPA: DUF4249 domain-containing protein [Bacteroidia bacterium]|jgi:hypothetical protein|nr:DUF4249 domain-containing protein [Bacteroidia bacterium]
MKSYFLFFAIGLISLLTSCEKDADVKLPTVEPKLVVSCVISPQNPLTQVAVSKSAPIYNSNVSATYQAIKGAMVVLSDGSNSWTLPFDSTHQTYALDSFQLKIKANTTYTLTVNTPDGKSVNASTTVPAQNTTLTYTTSYDSLKNKSTIHGKWQDPASSGDYYLLEGSQKINSPFSEWSYLDQVYVSDDNSGGILSANLEFYSSLDSTYLSLSATSAEFYKFFTRIKRGIGISSDDLFSEPVPLYTNINGGLGVFAGFNEYKVKIVP